MDWGQGILGSSAYGIAVHQHSTCRRCCSMGIGHRAGAPDSALAAPTAVACGVLTWVLRLQWKKSWIGGAEFSDNQALKILDGVEGGRG